MFNTEGTVSPNASASMGPVFVAESKKRMLDLIRKDPVYYRPLFPDVPPDLPYVWPPSDRAGR